MFPEIALKNVDGLAVARPVAEVTEADIDAMVENLRAQRPKFEAVERESREGDRVTMDFVGLIDGAEFEGSKGDDVAVLLGGGRMLKEFETGITGMKAGERAQDRRALPGRLSQQGAGRPDRRRSTCTMKKVEEKQLPDLDDEFCREYGVTEGGMEQLRSEVADNMRRELEPERARAPEAAAARPAARGEPGRGAEGLVDAQVREMQIDTARRIGAKDASQVPPPEPFVEPARRRVALGILVGELIKTRGIKLDRARVEGRLAEMAPPTRTRSRSSRPTARIRKRCARSRTWCSRTRSSTTCSSAPRSRTSRRRSRK